MARHAAGETRASLERPGGASGSRPDLRGQGASFGLRHPNLGGLPAQQGGRTRDKRWLPFRGSDGQASTGGAAGWELRENRIMRPAIDHRPKILKAAARLFAARPFHEVLMEDVAEEAGVSKGTVYRFYRSKEDLCAAIVIEWMDSLLERLGEALRPDADIEAVLGDMIARMAEHLRRQFDFYRVMQKEEANASLIKRPEFLARRKAMRDAFAKAIRRGRERSELRDVDPEAAADMIIGMTFSLMKFGSPPRPPEEVAAMVTDLFLNGAARSGKGGSSDR
ncbi:MAG: TetR/AcrR family transcriptional regulator [Planctomycetota bacterium]|nr:TetR/AcrR family transcriptional regulator [Planctomycetota bacterium]